ncbi:MAG: 2-C-methyl-D-erythritol 2,4-cyclodiphosphate synthase, partial [Clostridia bacterium]|nr:2-C-methyl-D-erythritol 2,4-cyclodiphosphate synthase [Clostridia bacterium]
RDLVLCGVRVPYELGLDGHSDADVALHALCDALLGAAALGDIGKHFPDTDGRYLGISSLILTERTREILEDAGYTPINVDVTIVAQKPKLAPYIEQMRNNVAKALRLPPEMVSVKATTTEKMGYEGRGEGISAQACAMVTGFRRNLL